MKATIISFLLVSLIPVSLLAKQIKSYSMVEVAKHNTLKSCWIVVEKKVYDVTGMIPHHNPIIQKQCGKDATEGFKTQGWSGGKHSKKAHNIRKSKQVGILKG